MTTKSTESHYLASGLAAPRAARDGLDEQYWSGAQRHELWVQRCDDCETFQWGPEWMCHACQSFDIGWAQVEPKGRIYSWQRAHHSVHPALADQGPYLIVLVELPHAGNVRMVGNLLGDPLQDMVIGDEVTAVFEDHTDANPAYTLVQWRVL